MKEKRCLQGILWFQGSVFRGRPKRFFNHERHEKARTFFRVGLVSCQDQSEIP